MKKVYTLSFAVLTLCGMSLAQSKTAAVDFSAVGHIVEIPHNNNLNLGSGAFTIEALIEHTTTTGVAAPIVVGKKQDGANSNGWMMGLKDDGEMAFELKGNGYAPGWPGRGDGVDAKDLRDGQCHHIAFTREIGTGMDTIRAYQDGQFVKRSRKELPKENVDNTDDVSIGLTNFGMDVDYQFEGLIKEVRIWSVTRTQQQIADNMYKHLDGNETGLVAYWRLNENSGTSVLDYAGSNNGTIKDAGWGEYCDVMDDLPGGSGIIENSAWVQLDIYPNPASDQIQIKGLTFNSTNVQVIDLNGRTLIQQTIMDDKLNVSDLKSGMYMLLLQSEDGTSYRTTLNVR